MSENWGRLGNRYRSSPKPDRSSGRQSLDGISEIISIVAVGGRKAALLFMLALPYKATIVVCATGELRDAQIVKLSAGDAQNRIDKVWWTGLDAAQLDSKPDCHWAWCDLVNLYGPRHENSCVALSTSDDVFHGAMIFGVNGASSTPDVGSVAIHWIATCPESRPTAGGGPKHKGCGKELVSFAVATSYSLGLEGIVNLYALPEAEAFYEHLAFTRTGRVDGEGLNQYELGPEGAKALLRAKGIDA